MDRFTLVTGASEGIGKELARRAAKSGRKVILTARSEDKLAALAEELGNDTVVIPADLSKPGEADRLWKSAVDRREIEILVNNAGLGYNGAFVDPQGWDREAVSIEVNVVAATRLMKLAVAHMQEHGARSRILNVASVAAFMPGPGMAVYHATKAFLLSLSEAADVELRDTRISVTALCPGATQSNFFNDADMTEVNITKVGRLPSAASVAEAGWNGMITGQRVVVPGAQNKATVAMARLAPRGIVAGITRRLLSRSGTLAKT
ncbi:SDR family NAD(P)-dependent oxidoreductase [Jannaschia aquimarina]|uniref:Putative oxidoreductase n=1 Tax=Jannaschia aquimarina TaxID=935700 RepID=A0A0D1DBI3_9RHOB|nr:SDR family oxidoreductase [Jannaschia aquimarina]KIT17308.1 putative oxidoreductase [Jannaschia aquimarina]SNT20038.1 hypothetical protein SAMN05421775_107165 [Jannaschia aquimarina]